MGNCLKSKPADGDKEEEVASNAAFRRNSNKVHHKTPTPQPQPPPLRPPLLPPQPMAFQMSTPVYSNSSQPPAPGYAKFGDSEDEASLAATPKTYRQAEIKQPSPPPQSSFDANRYDEYEEDEEDNDERSFGQPQQQPQAQQQQQHKQQAHIGTVDGVVLDLVACHKCSRKFARDRLPVHAKVCGKEKKRKEFNMAKVRVGGTDAEYFVKTKQHANELQNKRKMSRPNWKAQHEEFIANIRYAKEATKAEKEGGPLPPPPPASTTSTAHMVQCPTCQRRFNSDAAAKHIPVCKARPVNAPIRSSAPRR